ncbi:MAG: 50S ribosomal protein L28 [Gemmatimonadales bacterium]|nr:MAG: 50S ribosomal protein L28 [Gemmatimonadales bacterium]
MARVCKICGKGPRFGNQVSHAHNISQRVWQPNLQTVHVALKGARKRIRVCTRCIRSGAVVKAVS